ncbi:hypothetical protein B0H21DRAFT_424059 [Amylocystis lapponica]|nr:hypothetical protein B0H21DRAFT_424059 [Amylocystis lapponica]
MNIVESCLLISGVVLVMGLTLIKTYNIRRLAAEAHIQTSYSALLIRDGTVYFGVWLTVTILQAALSDPTMIENDVIIFLNIIPGILISHFMLNLRGVYLSNGNNSSQSSQASINFASRIAGI